MTFAHDLSSAQYWKTLAPTLHVDDRPFILEESGRIRRECELAEEVIRGTENRLGRDGYFQLAPLEWGMDLGELATLISGVRKRGLPAVFAFMFDEYWLLMHAVDPLLKHHLGSGYFRLPDFWAYYVGIGHSNSGWAPHRDKGRASLMPDGRPASLTVWIPLTDSTSLNGCIYAVPSYLDPTYGTEREGEFLFHPSSIRALPAAKGSVLGWNQALVHWGGKSSDWAAAPRISVAMEFQRADIPPFQNPVGPALEVPGFEERVRMIAKQLNQYRHMEPPRKELEDFIQRFISP